jgi:hypothetical protein
MPNVMQPSISIVHWWYQMPTHCTMHVVLIRKCASRRNGINWIFVVLDGGIQIKCPRTRDTSQTKAKLHEYYHQNLMKMQIM